MIIYMVFLTYNTFFVFHKVNCVVTAKPSGHYKRQSNCKEIRKQILAKTTNVNDFAFHQIFSKFEMLKISRIF